MGTRQIFDVIAIIYALGALRLALTLVRKPRLFWRLPLTRRTASLPSEIAFLLVHPLVVPIHELGHAIAVWALGGTVNEFPWRVFWGYVRWTGNPTALEGWWVSASGPLAEAAVGCLLLLAGIRLTKLKPMIRAILLRAGTLELAFTFIGYPVLSYAGLGGDWLVIFDLDRTPVPSALAIGVVALVALALYWGNKRIEMIARSTVATRMPPLLEKRGWLLLRMTDPMAQFWHPDHGGLITMVAGGGHTFGPGARLSLARALRSYEAIPGSRRGDGR